MNEETLQGHQFPTTELFGIPIAALTLSDALTVIDQAIAQRRPLQIGVVNAAKVVNMGKDPDLRKSVLSSDIILADGAGVVWSSKLLGQALPERVTGIDLMFGMLTMGNEKGYRVFLLGATDEVLTKVVNNIHDDYPGVHIAGYANGYFSAADEESIAEEIKKSRADILLVAITSPKKENFLARWSDYIDAPVCHGVGGSFDVYSGKVKRAPEIWQRLGFEWLYRVKQEPGRLWKRYLITNIAFIRLTLGCLLSQRSNKG